MYICLCKAVSDKTITELIEKGMSLKEIQVETGIGKNCGACLSSIKTQIKEKECNRDKKPMS